MCEVSVKLDWFQIGFGVKLFLEKKNDKFKNLKKFLLES
jgi:hypothetical protein